MAQALEISARIPNERQLLQRLAEAPRIALEEIERATWEAELLYQRETQELTPVGVGGAAGLRGSISAREPQRSVDGVLGVVGTSIAHAVPVELGTRPHFPPLQPLIDWLLHAPNAAQFDANSETAPGIALSIARKIAARGTPAVGMFHRAMTATRPQIARIYRRANQRILQRIARV